MLRSSVFAPFRVRSFRYQWPADQLVSWALDMEFLILGWYMLVETGSVVLLSIYGALQHTGTLIAPIMGLLSDRIGPRNLLTGMRTVYACIATTLMLLAFSGLLTPMLVLVLVGLMGLVRPSDLGLRAALIADTMPADKLTGAMGLSRLTTDLSRIAGALTGAGLVAWLGMGPTYVVIASFYAAGTILTMRADSVHGRPTASAIRIGQAWSELREGLVHIWNTPRLVAIMWLVLLFNFAAFPLTNGLLPYVARDVYQIDQAGLSYLISSVALGAMIGGLSISRLGVPLPRLMIGAAVVWHVLLLIYAQMQTMTGGLVMLFLAGVFQSLTMVSLTVILVQEAGQRYRGRVMGVRMLAIYSLPIGLLVAGAAIRLTDFSTTATVYASIGLVFTLVIALRWGAQLWRQPGQA